MTTEGLFGFRVTGDIDGVLPKVFPAVDLSHHLPSRRYLGRATHIIPLSRGHVINTGRC